MSQYAKKIRRLEFGEVGFNMTPMIDVVFQLILFFTLSSQIASEEFVKMSLAKPVRSQAIPAKQIQVARVVVNVVAAQREPTNGEAAAPYGQAVLAGRYEINGMPVKIGDTETLTDIFRARFAEAAGQNGENFFVEIRADKRVAYEQVRPVMFAAAEVGIPHMNITAIVNAGE